MKTDIGVINKIFIERARSGEVGSTANINPGNPYTTITLSPDTGSVVSLHAIHFVSETAAASDGEYYQYRVWIDGEELTPGAYASAYSPRTIVFGDFIVKNNVIVWCVSPGGVGKYLTVNIRGTQYNIAELNQVCKMMGVPTISN